MNPFSSNLIANFTGASWSALVQLACVPLFVRFLGVEAYGLVGFYIMLQASLQVLDLGLSPTMNREMARYSVQPDRSGEARNFVRTLEVGYWAIGIIIGALIFLAAPVIAMHWIKVDALSSDDVQKAISMMGALVALQWPLSLYQGGLMGLQRQVLLNAIRIVFTTLGSGGAVFILWIVSPTITAFLAWQMLIGAIHLVVITFSLWRSLPDPGRRARFDFVLIRPVLRFASGMTGIAFFSMILIQMDKIVLSKMLSLEMFGYYVLAGVVANGLQLFIAPIFGAIFPRLSALALTGDEPAIRRLYHQGSQLMAVLVLPAAAVVAVFSFEVVQLWTGSAVVSSNVSPIVTLLIIGTAMNGLMHLPYALQLAYGWTRLGLQLTIAQILFFLPLLLYVTQQYGAIGAAGVWALLSGLYLLIGTPLTHRRLLKGEAMQWLFRDVGLPLVAVLIVVSMARFILAGPLTNFGTIMALISVALATVLAAVSISPLVRGWLINKMLSRVKPSHA